MTENNQSIKRYILAFDIEKSGATDKYPIIGIGASVVNQDFKELERLFLPGYFPGQTPFESRCWDEFWNTHQEQLNMLEYKGPKPMAERQVDMIKVFQYFRKKWEEKCKQYGTKLEIVSDNNVFDGGFINKMIHDHLPDTFPLPYSATRKQEGTQMYQPFFETFSQQRGLLLAVDPEYVLNNDWGYGDRIKELYNVPEVPTHTNVLGQSVKVEHDHNPANDAYTIACDQQILFKIASGEITRK